MEELWRGILDGKVSAVREAIERCMREDLDKTCPGNGPPLIIACQRGDIEIVRLLIENGAKIEEARWNGLGVAHHAAKSCRPEIFEALFAAGCPVDSKSWDCRTPLIEVCRQRTGEGSAAVVRLLIKHGGSGS